MELEVEPFGQTHPYRLMNQMACVNKMRKLQYCGGSEFDISLAMVVEVEGLDQDGLFLNKLQNLIILQNSWV